MPRILRAAPIPAPTSRLGEGPLWDDRRSVLWWTDILGSTLHELTWGSGAVSSIDAPAAAGALCLSVEGELLASLPDGVWRVDGWERIAALDEDRDDTRCNDGKVDPFGRLVQGTMAWDERSGAGSVYRLGWDGEVETLLTDVTVANGLAWTADSSTFFHVDSPTRLVRRFPYRESGPLGSPEVLVELPTGGGYPDGMAIDDDECLWVALWEGSAVHRYTPDGALDTIVEVPAARVTSCCFAGPDLDALVITTAKSDDGNGGGLFTIDPGVAGTVTNRFGPS